MLIWNLRRKITQIFTPTLILFVVLYFSYHAIQGERGVLGWIKMTQKYQTAEKNLADLLVEKESLEKKIFLMGEYIDPDLLDQQVRLLLGYVHPDEVIILQHPRFKKSD